MNQTSSILIRPAVPQYAHALTQIALSAKRQWGYPKRWMEIWTPQLTFTPEYFEEHESWVAVDEDQQVGFCTLQDSSGIAGLENLWVLPAYIGKGIGGRLFFRALKLARQREYKALQLEADPNAVGFYEKMGMQIIGEHQYELDGLTRRLPLMEMTL